FELVARPRGERQNGAPRVLARVQLDERQKPALVFNLIRLVEQKYRRLLGLSDEIEDEAVAVARGRARVAYQADEVNARERVVHGGHHAPVKEVAGLMHAGRVKRDDLPLGGRNHGLTTLAWRLRVAGERV